MTKRVGGRIRECGGAPLCALGQAAFGYPIALLIDVPVFAVKGIAKGLYYGAKGIGFIGKRIGQGLAYPFKEHPQPPPASWEAYKKQVLRLQKRLAKMDKTNKGNYLWCKGNVPLSHGPSRATWESRCNPGDVVPRTSLPIEVRATNSGESYPMGLPKDAATTAATAAAAASARTDALADMGVAAPAVAPYGAPPTAPQHPGAPSQIAAAPAEEIPQTAPPLPAPPRSPPPAAADVAPPMPTGVAAPSPGTSNAAAPALPSSAKPTLKDPTAVINQSEETVKEAGGGGFESKEGMLGKKGEEVLKAFEATAAASPRSEPDYQALIASMARKEVAAAASALPASIHAGASTPPESGSLKRPKFNLDDGDRIVGDPEAAIEALHVQVGQTCVIMAVRALLKREGIELSEDDVFEKAFGLGFFHAEVPCSEQTSSPTCSIRYDASKRLCQRFLGDQPIGAPDRPLCARARLGGSTRISDIEQLLRALSGKPYTNHGIADQSEMPSLTAEQYQEIQAYTLGQARNEVRRALEQKSAVLVTLKTATLRGDRNMKGLHTVYVPAIVVGRDETIKGYVINDSATGSQRLIDSSLFERAWRDDNYQRAYKR